MCTSTSSTLYRGPPKLTVEATGFGERTVRRIVSEKSALSGAAFSSPAKRYKVDRKKDDFDTEALRRVVRCSSMAL